MRRKEEIEERPNLSEDSRKTANKRKEGMRAGRSREAGTPTAISYLLVQGFVVFKQGLERFEDLDFAGDPRGRLSLALDHGHAERALVSGHQALQVLQQELRRERAAAESAGSVYRRANEPSRDTSEPSHVHATGPAGISARNHPKLHYRLSADCPSEDSR